MPRIYFLTDASLCQAVDAPVGASILEAAKAHGVPLTGTCGGSMVCATCHVYIDEEHLALLNAPSDAEEETLDLAFSVNKNSRLGCQIRLTEHMDGMHVKLAPTMLAAMAGR